MTLISKIVFVGNHEFSEDRLSEVINSREERWWRFLSTSDEYDPERLNFDKELLRRFYLKNGYIDFEVKDAKSELAPDRSGFFLTFTISEGERYRVGKITINSQLRNLNGDDLRGELQIDEGDWYDGDAVGRSVDAMELDVHNRGYAFVEVKPRINRDTAKHTVDLIFDVGEGPRVYVERIDIVGNTRTKDKVIRREFRLAEGDAFSAEAVRRSRQRLQDLNYFNNVDINTIAGIGAGQGDADHHDRREGDRRTHAGRRLFDGCRRAARYRPERTQPDRHRHQCRHQRRAGAEAQFGHRLDHGSLLPRSQPGRRRRRVPDPDQLPGHRAV